jgi:hypothetical protein
MSTPTITLPGTDTRLFTELEIEDEIQAKGLTAPRITPVSIEANIKSEHYFTAFEGVVGGEMVEGQTVGDIKDRQALELLTFCILVLRNGFTVTGESACASPENFDAELGRKIARQNAIQKVWPLMGYALKEQLSMAPVVANLSDEDMRTIGNGCIYVVAGSGTYVRFDKEKKA